MIVQTYNIQLRKRGDTSKWVDIEKVSVTWGGTKRELADMFNSADNQIETVRVSHPASRAGTYFDNFSRGAS